MACRDVQVPFKPFNCIISSYTIFVGMLATRKAGCYRNFEMINATNKNSSYLTHTKRFNFKSASKPYCFIKTILKVGYFGSNIFKTHQRTINAPLSKITASSIMLPFSRSLKMIFEMHAAFAHWIELALKQFGHCCQHKIVSICFYIWLVNPLIYNMHALSCKTCKTSHAKENMEARIN